MPGWHDGNLVPARTSRLAGPGKFASIAWPAGCLPVLRGYLFAW
jgi:hypothetical protein